MRSVPPVPSAVLPNDRGAIYCTEDAPCAVLPDPEPLDLAAALPSLESELKRYQRFFRLEDNEAGDVILDAILEALCDLEALQATTRVELNAARRHEHQESLDRSYDRGVRSDCGPGVSSHHLLSH
jgi:hypothetical protein